ncbi:MAG: C39 family peptidase [Desulfomonilia bacterium]
MEVLAGFLIVLALLTSIHPIREVPESELAVLSDPLGIQQVMKFDVKPFTVMKDENIVKQQFDYSCGSAALATLLNYYLGEDFTEAQVIQGLMEYGDIKQLEERRAFSLLDMKRFVTVLGYQGTGYTAELDDLQRARQAGHRADRVFRVQALRGVPGHLRRPCVLRRPLHGQHQLHLVGI